jgi:hypothetical protein
LVATIAEEDYFQNLMNKIVRQSIDGEKETFEDLLSRVLNDYPEQTIQWIHFLAFFSKRGRYQNFVDL